MPSRDRHVQTDRLGAREGTIARLLTRERQRLHLDLGLDGGETEHYTRPKEYKFTAEQRAYTTVLFGGLTWRHERLIQGLLRSLGHLAQHLPTPDHAALQAGREYGNNGQCNPTYFTVGNLVRYLQGLVRDGMSHAEVVERYVFMTAGACGPCRFGMYEQEYRLALENAGFAGFRVILFEQQGGLDQMREAEGMRFDIEYFLGLLHCFTIGDMLGELAYRIRPYEVNPGATDRALHESVEQLSEFIENRKDKTLLDRLLRNTPMTVSSRFYKFCLWLTQLADKNFAPALAEVVDRFTAIETDYTRVCPLVKITGEFWAQIAEGDGNFNMFAFLEREGAEVQVEPIGNWLMYMLDQAKLKQRDRLGLATFDPRPSQFLVTIAGEARKYYRIAQFSLAEFLFAMLWQRHRRALGGFVQPLTEQKRMREIAHDHYNSRISGGEGHMEVAKNIHSYETRSAHMVLSLKPFGCMPSTQSDGVQAAVVNRHPGMVFLSVETAGEGQANAHSRVQMCLSDARMKAAEEFDQTLMQCRHSLREMREFAASRASMRGALSPIPEIPGVCGTAARFVRHVDVAMRARQPSC